MGTSEVTMTSDEVSGTYRHTFNPNYRDVEVRPWSQNPVEWCELIDDGKVIKRDWAALIHKTLTQQYYAKV